MEELDGLAIPRTLEDACDPRRLALVVYDMQVGILGQIAGGDAVLAAVGRTLAAAREARVRTLFLRHVTLPTRLMGAAQLRMWTRWQGAASAAEVVSPFPAGAPQTRLAPELAPREDEPVLDKLTMSAFAGTPLELVLRDCGITAVALVGVALEIGIEPTVRHATDLGFLPIVVTDACGAGHAEAGERALATMRFAGDALLTDVDGFAAAVRSSR